MCEELITRFNADHSAKIVVERSLSGDYTPQRDREYFGFEVLTTFDELADVFGVETASCEAVSRRIITALDEGARLFYLEMGLHSSYSFRLCREQPKRDWDSGCVGILVQPRDAWLNAMPGKTFATEYVFRTLRKEVAERIESIFNGEIFAAFMIDEGESLCMDGFLSPEEALRAMQAEYPEIRYCEEDFDVETTYRLAAA